MCLSCKEFEREYLVVTAVPGLGYWCLKKGLFGVVCHCFHARREEDVHLLEQSGFSRCSATHNYLIVHFMMLIETPGVKIEFVFWVSRAIYLPLCVVGEQTNPS